MKYSAIIPAYNEARTIERAVRETALVFDDLLEPYEIIVVDDGSTDETANIVQELQSSIPRMILLQHSENRGKGAAVCTGAAQATGDVFVFLDADLATHPVTFRRMLPALEHADIVIGSRTTKGSVIAKRQPLARVLMGKLFNLFAVRWYLGLPFHDTQCGCKAFKKETKPLFEHLQSHGWAFDVELLVRAKKQLLSVVEIPVEWRHGSESRVRLRDARHVLRELRAIKKSSC